MTDATARRSAVAEPAQRATGATDPDAHQAPSRVHHEEADVVIVGARCAGSAAAVHFARRGRRVVVLDKARFPADTLSTHLMVPDGVLELATMGALDEVLALNPTRCRAVTLSSGDVMIRERWPNLEGIDFSLCVPRTTQDVALVNAARAAGADVREGCAVEELLWSDGRAVGVR